MHKVNVFNIYGGDSMPLTFNGTPYELIAHLVSMYRSIQLRTQICGAVFVDLGRMKARVKLACSDGNRTQTLSRDRR